VGAGSALHVTFCTGGGGRVCAATPCAQRSSSTLAGKDRLRVVPSGLNEPQFPVVSPRNVKRDLARAENREFAGVFERGAGLKTRVKYSGGFHVLESRLGA